MFSFVFLGERGLSPDMPSQVASLKWDFELPRWFVVISGSKRGKTLQRFSSNKQTLPSYFVNTNRFLSPPLGLPFHTMSIHEKKIFSDK